MSKEDFIDKSKNFKQIIAGEENNVLLINRRLGLLKTSTEEDDQEKGIKLQYELKEVYLKIAYRYLLIYRLSEQYLNIKNETSMKNIRKNLTMIIGIWEKELGEDMNRISERDYLEIYRNLKQNQEIIEHFKLLIFLTDKLLSLITPAVKWYWAALDLKVSALISFCNAVDFKLMSKEYDPESPNYHFYHEVYQMMIILSEECIDGLWQKHHYVEEKNRTIVDIQLGIKILVFFIHFDHLLGDGQQEEKYRKKKQVWENYRENLLKKRKDL